MAFTSSKYDECQRKQSTATSVAPMQYQMYLGAYINNGSCNKVAVKDQLSLIDIESELRGGNRFHSRCASKQYQPGVQYVPGQANSGISTFDRRANIVVNPAVCPDVSNMLIFNSGIKRPKHSGIRVPSMERCS
jgi:hypothetical protein